MIVDASFQQATQDLFALIDSIPHDAYTYRPPEIPQAWTIQENIIHLVDSEVNAFLRLKSIVATPGSQTYVIDEVSWTREIDAHAEDVHAYLNLLRAIRKLEFQFLSHLDAERNETKFVIHPGEPHLDLTTWLSWYTTDHFDFHKKLMLRNLNLWRQSHGT